MSPPGTGVAPGARGALATLNGIVRALAVGLAVWLVLCAAAGAQDAPADLQDLVREAQARGARVLLIEPGQVLASQADEPKSTLALLADRSALAADRLSRILADLPDLARSTVATVRAHVSRDGGWWVGHALLVAAGAVAAGGLMQQRGLGRLRDHVLRPLRSDWRTPADRARYVLATMVLDGAGLGLQLTLAFGLVLLLTEGEARILASTVVAVHAMVAAVALVLRAMLLPDTAALRPQGTAAADTAGLYRSLVRTAVVALSLLATAWWTIQLPVAPDAGVLIHGLCSLLAAFALAGTLLRHRRTVAGLILSGDGLWRRALAATWHVVAVLYMALAWLVTMIRLLLDAPNVAGLIAAPVYGLLAGLAAHALALVVVDHAFSRRRTEGMDSVPAAALLGDDGEQGERSAYRPVAEHAGGIVATLVGLWVLVSVWGIRQIGLPVERFWTAVVVVAAGVVAWRAIRIAFEQRLRREIAHSQPEPGDEGGGASAASRLGTILPLFRNALLVLVAIICAMIVLAELGVDVAPLFAGAGIVGLAIGFGAQALVRDIFSGVFFLLDDAFRVGEYIQIGGVKGTVEKISVRSMQLRHHVGPLHTIPFGEIQSLTNYSRDWVIMKLPLRLTYDTDLELVRKLIKKLGQKLHEDPEIGHMFLEPLKSQGVQSMEDSAMIVRAKFMTRPGHQFQVRKRVYAEIRDLFEREGIRFAHREVTVRLSDPGEGRPREEVARSAGAAALAAVAAEGKQAGA